MMNMTPLGEVHMVVKFIETESKMAAAWGRGEGRGGAGRGDGAPLGMEFLFGKMKRVLEMGDDGCTAV